MSRKFSVTDWSKPSEDPDERGGQVSKKSRACLGQVSNKSKASLGQVTDRSRTSLGLVVTCLRLASFLIPRSLQPRLAQGGSPALYDGWIFLGNRPLPPLHGELRHGPQHFCSRSP